MRTLLCCLLLLTTAVARPIPSGDGFVLRSDVDINAAPIDEDHPPQKKPRTDEDDIFDDSDKEDNPSIRALSENKCWFSEVQKTLKETVSRSQYTEVSTECDHDLISMGSLIHLGENEYGSSHILDLIISRGAGMFDEDWDDEETLQKWNERKICSKHLKELWKDWKSRTRKHIKLVRNKNNAIVQGCTFPESVDKHESSPATVRGPFVQKHEARGMMLTEGVLIHIGTPVCSGHKKYVKKSSEDAGVKEAGRTIYPVPHGSFSRSQDLAQEPHSLANLESEAPEELVCIKDKDEEKAPPLLKRHPTTVSQDIKTTFEAFAKAANEPRVCRRKNFLDLVQKTKHRKAATVKRLAAVITQAMAPDAPSVLYDLAFNNKDDIWTGGDEKLAELLIKISEEYYACVNRQDRINVISLVADVLPLDKVKEFIPGLSRYFYYEAKRYARSRHLDEQRLYGTHVRESYQPEKVSRFIDFITSSVVLTGLPYGQLKTEFKGDLIQIPNTLRNQRAYEIIMLYGKQLYQRGLYDQMLSRTSLYEILKVCAATPRTSTTCVDYFIGDGMDAADELKKTINKWNEMKLIDESWRSTLVKGITEAVQYIRTDFRLHLKDRSFVADHCMTHALSDPSTKALADVCDKPNDPSCTIPHDHNLKCDRCEMVKNVFGDVRDTITTMLENARKPNSPTAGMLQELEEMEDAIYRYEDKIFELKRHMLRAKKTSDTRQAHIEGLYDGDGYVTIDWAQKFLPVRHREKQADYYGKRGLSYHISHVMTKIEDVFAQHSTVHIFNNDKQDSVAVTLLLEHLLGELKKAGINRVHIRADNAGCYHSSSTLASIFDIAAKSKVEIKTVTFSEAQSGKSSADRMAAIVKRKVRDYVDSGHNVETAAELFGALNQGKKITGLSAFLVTVENPVTSNSKIPSISSFYDFTVEKDGLLARRYSGIGPGTKITSTTLQANTGFLNIETSGGYTADDTDFDQEKQKIKDGESTFFWFSRKCNKKDVDVCVPADQKNKKNGQDDHSHTHHDYHESAPLFHCPENGCSATFLKHRNLKAHMDIGIHHIRPEKLSMLDYAVSTFKNKLEEVDGGRIVPAVKSSLGALSLSPLEGVVAIERGWAIRKKKTSVRYSEDAKKYLEQLYNEAVSTKKHMDPRKAEELMATVTNDGSTLKRFLPDDRLNWRQIASFFSRLAAKKNANNGKDKRSIDSEQDINDYEGDEEQIFLKDRLLNVPMYDIFMDAAKTVFDDQKLQEVTFPEVLQVHAVRHDELF